MSSRSSKCLYSVQKQLEVMKAMLSFEEKEVSPRTGESVFEMTARCDFQSYKCGLCCQSGITSGSFHARTKQWLSDHSGSLQYFYIVFFNIMFYIHIILDVAGFHIPTHFHYFWGHNIDFKQHYVILPSNNSFNIILIVQHLVIG